MKEEEKKKTIEELKILAQKVKKLKQDGFRQKRPIVIEFSGSPKSGKTSCINSLDFFLKRHGFHVYVVQERASVCPVSNKQSPMFNIWTSCMSLANMIGKLENENYSDDVLILDRGIFDALCWFQWLYNTKKMEFDLKKSTESFLLHFAKNIDIVFVFTATPEVSIKREFANQLTDLRGRIMNEDVLQQYRDAVEQTIKLHKSDFRDNIITIDTTKPDQDEVGKDVTKKTLDSLHDLLMEKIGYFIKTNELIEQLSEKKLFEYDELDSLLHSNRLLFGLRNEVENNDDFLQIIPIAVITNGKNEVLVAKKKNNVVSKDSPERNRPLLWFGGHTRESDCIRRDDSFLKICKSTLHRELKEELGIEVDLDNKKPIVLFTPEIKKSRKHLAICFKIDIDETTKIKLDPFELVQKTGTSKSGNYVKAEDIVNKELEDWSVLILDWYFGLHSSQLDINFTDSQ